MLFVHFLLYSSSYVGTMKNETLGATLELCQLKIKQFSLDKIQILKFSTKYEDNLFTLNFSMVPRALLFIFHAGSRRLVSKNLRNSSYKEITAGLARVSRLSSRFLWLWWNICTERLGKTSVHEENIQVPVCSKVQSKELLIFLKKQRNESEITHQ